MARSLVEEAQTGATVLRRTSASTGHRSSPPPAPSKGRAGFWAFVVVTTAAGEIDQLVRVEREQLLQMFVVALLVSIVLSLVLASTIANPLSDLAAAAELGRDGTPAR
jgi:two-component system sensor histidine kinase ChvG